MNDFEKCFDFNDPALLKDAKPYQKAIGFIVALVLLVPPMVVTELNLGPAAWLNSQQSHVLGGYFSRKLTFVLLSATELVMVGVPVCLVSFGVRWAK
jgi:hypothetical protein